MKTKFRLPNIVKYFLYTLLATIFLVSCSSGSDSSQWGDIAITYLGSPITELSVIELITIVFVVGLFTK